MNSEKQLINRGINTLEPLRFKYQIWYLSSFGVGIFASLITVGAYREFANTPFVWISVAIISVIAVIVMIVLTNTTKQELYEQFDSWRDTVISHIDSNACLQPNEYLTESYFDNSGLNSKYYNKYSGSNYLRVGNLKASYLSIKHEYTQTYYVTITRTNSQGQIETYEEERERTVVDPVFDGLLLVLAAPLPHSGQVILQPRKIGIPENLHKIHVANSYLVKHYSIGVSEKLIGHRILTPTLMEALWNHRQELKFSSPGYSYKDQLLYITIPHSWLNFGRYPGVLRQMNFTQLTDVITQCKYSIQFLKESAEKLKPS